MLQAESQSADQNKFVKLGYHRNEFCNRNLKLSNNVLTRENIR